MGNKIVRRELAGRSVQILQQKCKLLEICGTCGTSVVRNRGRKVGLH